MVLSSFLLVARRVVDDGYVVNVAFGVDDDRDTAGGLRSRRLVEIKRGGTAGDFVDLACTRRDVGIGGGPFLSVLRTNEFCSFARTRRRSDALVGARLNRSSADAVLMRGDCDACGGSLFVAFFFFFFVWDAILFFFFRRLIVARDR